MSSRHRQTASIPNVTFVFLVIVIILSVSFSLIVAFHVEKSHPFAPIERRLMMMQLKQTNSPFHIDTLDHRHNPFELVLSDQQKEQKLKYNEDFKKEESKHDKEIRNQEINKQERDINYESPDHAKKRLMEKKTGEREEGEHKRPGDAKEMHLGGGVEENTNHSNRRDLMTKHLNTANSPVEEKSGYTYTPTLKCTTLPNPNCVSSMIKISRRNSQGMMPRASIKSVLLHANGQDTQKSSGGGL